MLDGILTTALQIIIVLDICGAVLYFLMSGSAKAKGSTSTASTGAHAPVNGPTPTYAFPGQYQPALAGAGSAEPPPVPAWVNQGGRSATSIYGLEGAGRVAPEAVSRPGRIGSLFTKLKDRFRSQSTQETGETADLNHDRVRLNQVLESFREEM